MTTDFALQLFGELLLTALFISAPVGFPRAISPGPIGLYRRLKVGINSFQQIKYARAPKEPGRDGKKTQQQVKSLAALFARGYV